MSLRRNVASVFTVNLLGKVFNAMTLLLIIRLYDDDLLGYAAYTNAHAVFSFSVGFVFTAFNIGMVRYGGEYRHLRQEPPTHLYHTYLALQTGAFAVLLLGSLLLPDQLSQALFGSANYVSSLRFGLVAGGGYCLANWLLHVLQTEGDFYWYNQLNFWRQALLLPVVAGFYWLPGAGLEAIMLAILVTNLVPAVWVAFRLRLVHLLRLWEAPRSELFRQVRSIRILLLVYGIHTVFDQIGVFLLGHFSTPQEVARFGVLFRYYGAAMLLVVSLNAILLPRFTQALLGDRRGQQEFFFRWLRSTLPAAVPLGLALYFGRPAWVALNTPAYAELYPSAAILAMGVFVSLLFLPAASALIAQSRYIALLLYLTVCLGLFGTLSFFWLPVRGAAGAAELTFVISNVLFYVLMALDAFVLPRGAGGPAR